ncbi:hypothetical protein GCM10020331_090340 [Ectobacillus funiculus]
MSKLGRQAEANVVINGLIRAAGHFEYHRLPELFCGYSDSLGKAVNYPVACSPQAWAAGTPLVFVQALLGLFPNSLKKEIQLSPNLLEEINVLTVEDIAIGDGALSVTVMRTENGYETTILQKYYRLSNHSGKFARSHYEMKSRYRYKTMVK